MIPFSLQAIFAHLLVVVAASGSCKTSPDDSSWPSANEWQALNQSIQGTLIKTAPAASSCYPGNPFGSSENCTVVKNHWTYASYHSSWPESVDYPIYANNSCLPQGATGYTKDRGCEIGGLPRYIVNATTEMQIATAMKWASHRNIRVVVKGTGHDLNGRSTGAFSLSIWTHNFKHTMHHPNWIVPGRNETVDVLVCGSGNNWGSANLAAHKVHRVVVGGEDSTVGLGGLIQNGGHGWLSSHYGLASDQVYQATVITTDGHRLVANAAQNQDLFWAIRGGGGGQFGVVTEFVLKTYPEPKNMVTGGFSFHAVSDSNVSESASWTAMAELSSLIPDIMDTGLTGSVTALTGQQAVALMGLKQSAPGVAVSVGLTGYNMTTRAMNAKINNLVARIANATQGSHLNFSLTAPTSKSYYTDSGSSTAAGAVSLLTSRLLGRRELSDIPKEDLIQYLQRILVSDGPAGSMLLFGLQGGLGLANVPEQMRGSVHPAWRQAYAHVMTYGASINATGDPTESLKSGAKYYERVKEPVWREWAPNTGAYMNEGNPFSTTWKQDFYGENYEKLLEIKRKYDPSESLFIWSGIGSDMWDYDLKTGLLCRTS
ncbi:FAD-binding, type 2 [Penicillium griseofulvum]|uniref:FAD-binding, type 2 n=1 Tax=Penicillium patulum TaxID=5078 RepID=A0A135LZG9_PENPA|nr:FAD-binding, type 2 [Penicillium griseofulvum]KXG54331.1 FAD-binding, type 2 [Penicillium griseofulvum]